MPILCARTVAGKVTLLVTVPISRGVTVVKLKVTHTDTARRVRDRLTVVTRETERAPVAAGRLGRPLERKSEPAWRVDHSEYPRIAVSRVCQMCV
jgi:hypothetical protein